MAEMKPAFEVYEVKSPPVIPRYRYDRIYLKDEDGEFVRDDQGRKVLQEKKRVKYAHTPDKAWDVYFPKGHAIRVHSALEMHRMGFFNRAKLIEVDGEREDNDDYFDLRPVDAEPETLRENAHRNASRGRKPRGRAATGATSAGVSG